MATPNLMVESSVDDLAEMMTALSFHVGEVQRNPYHLLVPPWMQDNVRRGGELVGGQGGAAPDFVVLHAVPAAPLERRPASGDVCRWPQTARRHERLDTAAHERHRLRLDAVLFDMDGTLVDSRHIVERMWILWATEHGLSVDAALALAHGRRTLETMELLAPHLATPEEAARLDALEG